MITRTVLALALALQVLTPSPASAVSFSECQAWLCLPGGFPPWECNAAEAAVISRLNRFLPALPSWSSCASEFDWDSASLGHNDRWYDECPQGGTPDEPGINASTCTGENADGCSFSYSAQRKVTVQVSVDSSTSFEPNTSLTHVARPAGDMNIFDCPPPEENLIAGNLCPPGMDCSVVGPPAPTAGPGGFN